MKPRLHFAFLNVGHFFDHLFMLVYATVAALALTHEWHISYAALIPCATPGFVAFGIGAVPAGWLADKWSCQGMMAIFFVGIGASAILTALAGSPLAIGAGLLAIGLFAAIYHPVGLALVVERRARTGMALAVNGAFGNLGVACAALITGLLIGNVGWRAAFVWPGIAAIATGLVYGVRHVVTFSVMALSVPMVAWICAGWGFGTLFTAPAVAAAVIFATVLLLPSAARPVAA